MTERKRAPRSDATANRDRILDTARAALRDPAGAEVSMAEIARRSGLGSGTLYRHFRTRRELLEALYVEEVDAICEAASDRSGSPETQFVEWLREFFTFTMSKRHVAVQLLQQTDSTDPVFEASRNRVIVAGDPLLRAAQHDGRLDDRLHLGQILDLIVAIAQIDGEPNYVEPILDAVLRGLHR